MATGGNDFDASARTIYNRLVEFKHGDTAIEPGLAESWEISDDGLTYTFHLRPGIKFHTTSYFTPTRDLNADDVIFSFERQCKEDNPFNAYLQDMPVRLLPAPWHAELSSSPSSRVDDLTVMIMLNVTRTRRCWPTSAWTSPRSCPRNMPTSSLAAGTLAEARVPADRHRPVPVRRLPARFGHPLRRLPRLLEGQGQRSTT